MILHKINMAATDRFDDIVLWASDLQFVARVAKGLHAKIVACWQSGLHDTFSHINAINGKSIKQS